MPTIADVLDSYRNNMPDVWGKALPSYVAGVNQRQEQEKNQLGSVLAGIKLQNEMAQTDVAKQKLGLEQEDAQRKRIEDYYNKFYGAVSATKDDPEKFKRWQDLGYVPQDLSFGDAEAWLMSGAAYKAAQNLKDSSYYGNPIYAEGPQGTQVYQLNKQGQAKAVEFPAGVTPSKPLMKMDLGGTQAAINPLTGGVVAQYGVSLKPGEQPEVKGAQAGAELKGKVQQQAQIDLPKIEQSASYMEGLLNKVLNHPGLPYAVGAGGILPTIPGTKQSDFVSLLDQVKGRAFLDAYNTLKGGGQITEVEGKKATDALARLSRTQSVQGFKNAIHDYMDVINLGVRRARRMAGQNPGTSTTQQEEPTGNVIDFNSLPP